MSDHPKSFRDAQTQGDLRSTVFVQSSNELSPDLIAALATASKVVVICHTEPREDHSRIIAGPYSMESIGHDVPPGSLILDEPQSPLTPESS